MTTLSAAPATQEVKVRDTFDEHWDGMSAQRFDDLYRSLAEKPRWFRVPFTCGPAEEVEFIASVAGDVAGKRILELGSGIGWTSLALARAGARVTVADLSDGALGWSRRAFERAGCEARWVEASVFDPAASLGTHDVVFNSGLIEHFYRPDQVAMLSNMAARAAPGGHVVAVAPYAGGRLYRWAKRAMEARGRWRFGDEFPPATMVDLAEDAGLEAVREHTFKPGEQMNYVCGVHRPLAWLLKCCYLVTGADATPLWRHAIGDARIATAFRVRG